MMPVTRTAYMPLYVVAALAEELIADWSLVMNGEDPFRIQPLQ